VSHLIKALLLVLIAVPAYADDLCQANTFTRPQAQQGKREYDSSCGLCHQYNLTGRVPGNYRNETPDIHILDANYMKTLDGNGGMIPPLLGEAFFRKWKDQKVFADRISNAIGAFPPQNYAKPVSDARIAAYILYRNCGKL
jgi:mono/diheme cytochrome c family protein